MVIYDNLRNLSNNQIYIEIRDGFILFDRLSRDKDLADQNCVTTGKRYYCEFCQLYSGVRDFVAIVLGDKEIRMTFSCKTH